MANYTIFSGQEEDKQLAAAAEMAATTTAGDIQYVIVQQVASEWVSSFLTAHEHIKGYPVP